MLIRPIESPQEIEAASELLRLANWSKRVSDPETLSALVQRSQLALVAIEDGNVIGFLRGLTDGIFNGYISMLVVAEAHRGKGVGSALVRAAIGENKEMTWVLRAGNESVGAFYEKLGFSTSRVAMERRGQRD